MKTVKINSIDFTDCFASMQVTYKKVTGQNGGVMLSGETEEDILKVKSIVTLPCMPLTEARQSQLLAQVVTDGSVSLYYYEPKTASYRTITALWSVDKMKHRGKGGTGNEYWTGLVCTFEEK